jgi:hypothetical protein
MTYILIYISGVVAAFLVIFIFNKKDAFDELFIPLYLFSWLTFLAILKYELPQLKIFKRKNRWEYGWVKDRWARRHTKKGNVQFILWQAGEQGWMHDKWADFDKSWWADFTTEKTNERNHDNQ